MEVKNRVRITSTAATVAALLGIEPPRQSEEGCAQISDAAAFAWNGARADRVVMYNPDAVALYLYQKYTELYAPMTAVSPLAVPILSVMPSVTPVCFASMYTGAMPEVHGIRKYEKPVLTTDTIFDACIRAGKKCAIVSTEGDSMSRIFLERDMDYFIFPCVEAVNDKAFSLLSDNPYDLLVIYNGDYDGTMHRYGPESDEALSHLAANCQTFRQLHDAIRMYSAGERVALAFAPDHGCHAIDGGLGSHGLDMEEDMNILHFWKFIG